MPFSGEDWWMDDESDYEFNAQVLYIRVPKNLRIIDVEDRFELYQERK